MPAGVWKFTPIWQVPPTARDAGQLFEATGEKSAAAVPVNVGVPTGSGVLPVFVTVTVCAVLVTPGPCGAKVRVAGLREPDVVPLMVPFSAAVCVPAESVMDNVPETSPGSEPAGGANVTVTAQALKPKPTGAKVVWPSN